MKNWSELWKFKSGGLKADNNYYTGLAIIYFIMASLNILTQIIQHKSMLGRIHFTLPLILFAIFMLTNKRIEFDFIIDLLICMILTAVSTIGVFSGISFLLILYFRTEKQEGYYCLWGLIFLSVAIGAVISKWDITSAFVMLAVNIFLSIKYYKYIHLPVKNLRQTIIDQSSTISELKHKLSILGTSKALTNDQILDRYTFMRFTDDNPYRKINDFRMLSEGKNLKEIAFIDGIKQSSNISDQFVKIRKDIEVFLSTEDKEIVIPNIASLILIGVELGIIRTKSLYEEK